MKHFVLIAALCQATIFGAAAIRGVWVNPLTNTTADPNGWIEITNKVNLIKSAGLNSYFANCLSPAAFRITNGIAWDDIADIIRVANAEDIDVYLWFSPFKNKSSSPEKSNNPAWLSVRRTGQVTNSSSICMFRPEVRQWETEMLLNLAARWTNLAGFQLEEPGYDTIDYCVCDYCTNWFQVNLGLDIMVNDAAVQAAQKAQYRAAGNEFVEDLRTGFDAIRPGITISCGLPSADPESSAKIGVDWRAWLSNSWAQWYTPQLYSTNSEWVSQLVAQTAGYVPVEELVVGLGISWSGFAPETQEPAVAQLQVANSLGQGVMGYAFFRLEYMTEDMAAALSIYGEQLLSPRDRRRRTGLFPFGF